MGDRRGSGPWNQFEAAVQSQPDLRENWSGPARLYVPGTVHARHRAFVHAECEGAWLSPQGKVVVVRGIQLKLDLDSTKCRKKVNKVRRVGKSRRLNICVFYTYG